jgi:preprotein translocase subunit SecA
MRKHLVEYDDVMNKHREVIYKKRRRILESQNPKSEIRNPKEEQNSGEQEQRNIKSEILDIVGDNIEAILTTNIEDSNKAKAELMAMFPELKIDDLNPENIKKKVRQLYEEREKRYTPEVIRNVERAVYLRTIDMLWVEHLTTMDELRTGIGLRGYGQRDPLVEYKQEAYLLFQSLLSSIENTVAKTIFKVEIAVTPTQPITRRPLEYQAPDPDTIGDIDKKEIEIQNSEQEINQPKVEEAQNNTDVTTTIRQKGKTVYERMAENQSGPRAQAKSHKVGRNDPCPFGSGKKYKKCCGK